MGIETERPEPCPFCGGDGVYNRNTASIRCKTCAAEGPDEATPVEAIQAWNRRAPSPELISLREAGWQDISTAPKDGRSIALWVADGSTSPHCFSPVSITDDGGWWDDSIGNQIEPIPGAKFWREIPPPSTESNSDA